MIWAVIPQPQKLPQNEDIYYNAVELYDAGNYSGAYLAFNSIDYKDSAERAAECEIWSKLRSIEVGSRIEIGSFEQDNNLSNGKEDIEWEVLAINGNKALLISRYALERQEFNSIRTDTKWETCSLRKWLNGTFFNTAFDTKLQNKLITTGSLSDKVFLLSLSEVNQYFPGSDYTRECYATVYADRIFSNVSGDKTSWWLRTTGYFNSYAAYIYDYGDIREDGASVDYIYGVRPAMWINLEP